MTNTTTAPAKQTARHQQIGALRAAIEAAAPVLANRDRHERICPTAAVRVTTNLGTGRLVSVTEDGWCEVQLDGETRRDEYPIEVVALA